MNLLNTSTIFILIVNLIIYTTCYDIPSSQLDQLSKGGDSAMVLHNGVIYSYSSNLKNINTNEYNPGDLYKMYIDPDGTEGGFHLEYLSSFGNYGYGQLLLLNDNQTLLTIGGESNFTGSDVQNDQTNQTNQTNQTVQADPSLIPTMKLYHIPNNTWSNPPIANASTVPLNRARLAAAVAPNGLVYILGGDIAGLSTAYDFYSYNPTTGVFTNLTPAYQALPYYTYPGTCASLITKPDGNILILFGTTFDSDFHPHYTGSQIVHSFNTSTGQWTSFNNTGYPDGPTSGRLCPTVMMNPNKTAVYVFGGGSTTFMSNTYLYNDILIYNLTTNKWAKELTVGHLPIARYFAAGSFMDNNHLLVTGGIGYNQFGRYLDVLRLPSEPNQPLQWIKTYNEDILIQDSYSIDSGMITVIVICTLVSIIIIGILLWWFRKYLKIMILNLQHDIWRPRTGEPNWAEMMRITSLIILLFLFIAFAIFISTQVYDSQSVTIIIDKYVSEVHLPNVRVCVEGTAILGTSIVPDLPAIQCVLPNGILCDSTDYKLLDLSVFRPDYGTNLPNMTCSYFNSGNKILIGSGEIGTGITSTLQFNIYTNTSDTSSIHVDLFPHDYDPIENIYYNVTNLIPEYQVTNWKEKGRMGSHVTNSYDLLPGQYTYISYQLVDHKYLTGSRWSYIGLKPFYNSIPELQTTQRTSALKLDIENIYSVPASSIRISPQIMAIRILQEQKLYSVASALSYLGGLFSLFITIQTLLFGFRPSSPWGLVHRWSIGELKRSISNGLVSNFQTIKTPIPFVNPTHPRFSALDVKSYGFQNNGPFHGDNEDIFDDDNDDDYTDDDDNNMKNKEGSEKEPLTQIESNEDRFELIENRLQLMELIFKSYYINDDIFKSLDKAMKKEQKRKRKNNNNRKWDSLSTLENEYSNSVQKKKKTKNWLPNLKKKTNPSLLEQNISVNDNQSEQQHQLSHLTTATREFNPTIHQTIEQQQDLLDNNNDYPSNYPN